MSVDELTNKITDSRTRSAHRDGGEPDTPPTELLSIPDTPMPWNEALRSLGESNDIDHAAVEGLLARGFSPEGIGRFARRRGIPASHLFRATHAYAGSVRKRFLDGFLDQSQSRALKRLKADVEVRGSALDLFVDRRPLLALKAILTEITSGGGILSHQDAARVAALMNELGLSLSVVAAALAHRGIEPDQISYFMYGLLDYWDVDRRRSDVLNARRFVAMFGHDCRHVKGSVGISGTARIGEGTLWVT